MIALWVVLFVLLGSGSSQAVVGLTAATGRPVTRLDIDNPSRVSDAEVEQLFLLRPGDAYDWGKVQRSLQLLAQKVEIRDVIVRGEIEGEGIALHLDVVPEPLVRKLRFKGNRALKRSQLASELQTRVDQPARDSLLIRDAAALEELYRSEGFPSARVTPRVDILPDGHWLQVVFDIDEGQPLPIVRVEVSGDPPPEREQLLAALGLRKGDPASASRFRDGVRRVVEVLQREDYLEARAESPRFRAEDQGAVLVLPLEVGERVTLILDGIDEWTGRPLRAIARSRFGKTIDEKWARRVADLMEDHLRAEGYLDVAVSPELGHAFGHRTLAFHVNRGSRVHADRVMFEGNETVPSRRLRRYMSLVVGGILRPPPLTQKALDRDLKTLGDYYVSRGHLDARVAVLDLDVPASGKAQLLIRVDEGAQYRWRDVLFVSDGPLSVEEARATAAIQSGSIASPNVQEEARLRLLKELERRGYPGAVVTYRETKDTAGAVVDVAYHVAAGPLVRFGKTVISGNARTKTRVIRRGLTFREGDPWDQQKLLQSRQLLYRLGVFQQVRIEALATTTEKGMRDVRVAVVEQDAGSVTFGLGYGTEEKLKGFGAISHANLQGAGRTFGLRAEFDDFDSSYAANFREPWLFNRRFDLRLALVRSFQNREAYNLASWAFQSALERIFTERIRGSIVYTLESNRLSDVVDEEVEELNDPDLEEYLLSAVGPVLAWDSRNDPFNPKRGFYHTFQAEFALEPLGSEVAYQRFLGSASGFFTVGRYTLALQGRAGLAVKLGQTVELPANKRFYLGGRTSVRGFKRDEVGPQVDGTPIGGDTMVNLRAEVRFPIWKQFGGALFWDAGNVWNRFLGASDYLELRHGVGGGLRYVTPVGPLSIDLGFKLDRKSGESPYQWHFTAGSVF